MPELLLEILSEEIPARMQARAADRLREQVSELLDNSAIPVPHNSVTSYVTPRRLTVVANDVPARQPDIPTERRGPRIDAPAAAIEGFLGSVGMTLDQVSRVESPKGTFLFARKVEKGRPTSELLVEKLPDLIYGFDWPKSMRWADTAVRWVRPVHGVLCVFGGRPLPFELDFGISGSPNPIPVSNRTRGHRFMAPKAFRVKNFADYREKLRRAKVMIDPVERRAVIEQEAERLAAAEGLTVVHDEGLLDEVAGLVEWPVVLIGAFDPAFLDVPEEALIASMRGQQKYFSLRDGRGNLAPRFIVVANTEADDGGAAIVAGNERVLKARLADAKFFWDHDRGRRLGERTPALKDIVFHARLGTLADKAGRVEALAAEIARSVPGADAGRVRSAARLAKADLVTGMVGEFPELQGIMGRYYALHDGEHREVADAIADHYRPQGPGDRCPTAPVSVAVALADRIDTLVGFWGIDEKPTGSKDPFALRRAALGAIRLIVENGLRLTLLGVFKAAHGLYPDGRGGRAEAVCQDLLAFFADRLKVHLREKGVRHDLVSAVFALGGEDDLVRLLARVDALSGFLGSEDGANLLVAFRRAANILAIEERRDGVSYADEEDPQLLRLPEEKALHEKLVHAGPGVARAIAAEQFANAMAILAGLRRPVDAFFDKVTVNCDDRALRANRLRLLHRIRAALGGVADFSRVEG